MECRERFWGRWIIDIDDSCTDIEMFIRSFANALLRSSPCISVISESPW